MQPSLPLWRRISLVVERLVPSALTLLLLMLSALPKRFLPIADFSPLLGIAGIYYWGLFKPRAMPYWLVFAFGLLQDILSGTPLGLFASLFLLVRMAVASQHRAFTRETFLTVWFGFAVLCTGLSAMYWTVMSLFNHVVMPIAAPTLQWMLTIALYPPLHRLFNALYTKISNPAS